MASNGYYKKRTTRVSPQRDGEKSEDGFITVSHSRRNKRNFRNNRNNRNFRNNGNNPNFRNNGNKRNFRNKKKVTFAPIQKPNTYSALKFDQESFPSIPNSGRQVVPSGAWKNGTQDTVKSAKSHVQPKTEEPSSKFVRLSQLREKEAKLILKDYQGSWADYQEKVDEIESEISSLQSFVNSEDEYLPDRYNYKKKSLSEWDPVMDDYYY